MKYRELGKTGLKVSEIGIGTEYLVKASKDTIKDIVSTAVEAGCNYFDILFDNPEYLDGFGEALKRIRDKVIITSHISTLDSITRCKEKFDDFLERVKCEYVDILFISCCDREEVYNAVTDMSGQASDEIRIRTLGQDYILKHHGGHLKYARELQEQCRVKYLGFSTHVLPTALRAINDEYFDVLMFPINPIFDALPGKAGMENLNELWELAIGHKNIKISDDRKELHKLCMHTQTGLVAMKPFAGGWLFNPDLNANITPVQLISYTLSQSGVTTVVPGVSDNTQLKSCLQYLEASNEDKDFSSMLTKLNWNPKDRCMYCNHCQPCRSGIDIAQINRIYDLSTKYGLNEIIKKEYDAIEIKPDICIGCGDCVARCPFGINVPERMTKAFKKLI